MMYINKNAYSTNILALTQLPGNIINPYYLFEFCNDFDQSVTYFSCLDTSAAYCAYNEFVICETGSTSTILSAGTVHLTPGSYTYNVYVATAITTSISGTTGRIISAGNKAFVNGTDQGINEIYL